MDTLNNLIGSFLSEHPEEAVRIMEHYRAGEVADLLETLSTEQLTLVFANVLPVFGAACLELLDPVGVSEALQSLPGDTVLELLRSMKKENRQILLETFSEERRKAFIQQLRFPEGTAGSVMNPLSVVLTEDLTVDEALQRVRAGQKDPAFYPYVVDDRQHLVGRLTVRALMLADPGQKLSEIMQTDVVRVPAKAGIMNQIRIAGSRSFQSLPVVGDDGVLVGVVPPDRLANLQTAAPGLNVPAAAADILATLSTAYWKVLSTLLAQTASLFPGRSGRPNRS